MDTSSSTSSSTSTTPATPTTAAASYAAASSARLLQPASEARTGWTGHRAGHLSEEEKSSNPRRLDTVVLA